MSEFKPVGRFIEPGPSYRGAERMAYIRSYLEYSEANVADSNGYWLEGEKVFSQSQVFEMIAAASTPPQPIYDEAKERRLFEKFWKSNMNAEVMDLNRNIYPMNSGWSYACHETNRSWMTWAACAQSRAKAGEDE